MGDVMARGLARLAVTRALATLRSLLAFAVADGRVAVNAAAIARAPTGGQLLSLSELAALATACNGPYGDLIMVLGLEGLRWGEVAGPQVGDRVSVPGLGLRLSRTVLASNSGGALYVDSLKSRRARTVPLIAAVVPIVERWAAGKSPSEWMFHAPAGGPLREPNCGAITGTNITTGEVLDEWEVGPQPGQRPLD
jgi:integrase